MEEDKTQDDSFVNFRISPKKKDKRVKKNELEEKRCEFCNNLFKIDEMNNICSNCGRAPSKKSKKFESKSFMIKEDFNFFPKNNIRIHSQEIQDIFSLHEVKKTKNDKLLKNKKDKKTKSNRELKRSNIDDSNKSVISEKDEKSPHRKRRSVSETKFKERGDCDCKCMIF
jgi:hypothetical protein